MQYIYVRPKADERASLMWRTVLKTTKWKTKKNKLLRRNSPSFVGGSPAERSEAKVRITVLTRLAINGGRKS